MRLKGERIAAYARYSSDKQSVSSVDDQLRRFRSALAPVGRDLNPALTFTDHAVSGKSTDRPGFEALMERIKGRELDVLIVEDVSRLARNQSDATRLYEELAYYGVQLISLGDGIDTQQKGAKLQFGVKAANYPLIPEDFTRMQLPSALVPFKARLYGLTITPERLREIRQERRPGSQYADLANCRYEVDAAEKLMRREGIRWINSTAKSIEEIATTILRELRIERHVY